MPHPGPNLSCGGGDLVRGAEPDWQRVVGSYRLTYQALCWSEGVTLGPDPPRIRLNDQGRYDAAGFPIWRSHGSKWRLADRVRVSGRWHGLVFGVLAPAAQSLWGVRLEADPPRKHAALLDYLGDPVLARTDRGFELRFTHGAPDSHDVMIFTQIEGCRSPR